MAADFIKASRRRIPANVSHVTKTLTEADFEAYLVGGCVRDLLRNTKPKDWDITTNARPEEIAGLFEHTFYENDFGTVSVVNDDTDDDTLKVIEVTPYRIEGQYSDNRRPDEVTFSDTLEDDLKRRDFTINAIAYDPQKDKYVDPFEGQKDIKDRIIRTVGDPEERFGEDALRMLRAVRIQAELGFDIETYTRQAVQKHCRSLESIANERIKEEFKRIILSPHPKNAMEELRALNLLPYVLPELEKTFHVTQNQAHSYDVWTHLLHSVQHAADKEWPLKVRLAALLHDIGKPQTKEWDHKKRDWSFHGHEVVGAKIAGKVLKRLTFSKEVVSHVTTLIRWHMFFSDPEEISLSAVRRMVRNVGKENVWDLMNLRICDRIGTGRPKEEPYRFRKYQSMIEEALRSPVNVQNLAIDGNDLMNELGMEPGPNIGNILTILLEEVLDDPERNTRDTLLNRAHEILRLSDDEIKDRAEKGRQRQKKEDEEQLRKIRNKYGVK